MYDYGRSIAMHTFGLFCAVYIRWYCSYESYSSYH